MGGFQEIGSAGRMISVPAASSPNVGRGVIETCSMHHDIPRPKRQARMHANTSHRPTHWRHVNADHCTITWASNLHQIP